MSDLRARFRLQSKAVLGAAVATGFDAVDEAHFRARIPEAITRETSRPASVLPTRARDAVALEDDTTKLRVRFALRGATESRASVTNGIALYEGALAGADVIHRVHAEGTEDYVSFASRPASEEIVYDVDVSQVAGLRLVNDTLELLDHGGAPRLRVAPPYVVDGAGKRTEAALSVEGCAHDAQFTLPRSPRITPPRSA